MARSLSPARVGLAAVSAVRYDLGMPQELVQVPELTAAVQDYAKAIYSSDTRDGMVSTTALAERLDVRPASVSGLLRKLAVLGLVEHERYRRVRLTERGRAGAGGVIPPPRPPALC